MGLLDKLKLNRRSNTEKSGLIQTANFSSGKKIRTSSHLERVLKIRTNDIHSGRYKIILYRFLSDNIPVINAGVWTWVRMAAGKGEFKIINPDKNNEAQALTVLDNLSTRLAVNLTGNRVGLTSFLAEIFEFLFRDGMYGGFITVKKDGSGVDQFIFLDPADIYYLDTEKERCLVYDNGNTAVKLSSTDFYFIPLGSNLIYPLGRSILQAIPFVGYIEQQLVDDMRRSSHNSGFHRLHVKVTPPERFTGEAESAYIDRINHYFDSTVGMIRDCDVADNPVTWDNVEIVSVGPENARSVTNSWFMNHRAMIEEICAGLNLAPFLLGYSYGATTTWSGFKFDMVMRQVESVQSQVAHFMEWIGNIELALHGIDCKCKFEFDNIFTHQAIDDSKVKTTQLENILKIYESGLIDQNTAKEKIRELL